MVSIWKKAKLRRRPSALVEKGILPAGRLRVDGQRRIARTRQQPQERHIQLHTRPHRMPQRKQPRHQRTSQEDQPVNRLTRRQSDPWQRWKSLVAQQCLPPLRRWKPSLGQQAQARCAKDSGTEKPIPQRHNPVRRKDNHRQSRTNEKNTSRPLPRTPGQKHSRHRAKHKNHLHQRRAKGRIRGVFLSAGHELR